MLAINTENIFPKLELAVALIYFMMLPNTSRPINIPCFKITKSLAVKITSAASFTTSTAELTDIPTSAALIAGTSLIPSPFAGLVL